MTTEDPRYVDYVRTLTRDQIIDTDEIVRRAKRFYQALKNRDETIKRQRISEQARGDNMEEGQEKNRSS